MIPTYSGNNEADLVSYGDTLTGGVSSCLCLQAYMNNDGATGSINAYDYSAFGTSATISAQVSMAPGTWHHVALVSSGGVAKLYYDGVAIPATSGAWIPSNYTHTGSTNVVIGSFGRASGAKIGEYVDELRVSGYAVYTANFTPPTSPFSNAGTLATSYDLQRNGASIATVTGGATAYADTMPAPGSYSYQVFAGAPGADVSAGSNIVTLGYLATIPNVVGMTQAVGTATLNAAGFFATPIYQSSSTVPAGVISAQNPGPVPFPLGANVIITVSTGAPQCARYGGDEWGTNGGDCASSGPEILGHTLAQGAHPANALNAAPSQSVMAAMSAGQLVYQSTPDLSVPSTPKVG